MFERLIRFAIEQRWLVLVGVLAMAGLGVASCQRLAIDAVPDITNVQVQVNTQAPGHAPLEVEQRITWAIETAMAGLPRLQQTRSLSRYGLSQVTVVFDDGTDLYFARQLVNERLQSVVPQLPPGVSPAIGPVSTGLGEVYSWIVEADPGARRPDGGAYTLADLREVQDWIIRPQLRTVPGVTEVNSIGGHDKQYQVAPSPERLAAHGLTTADLLRALERNNGNVAAGHIEQRGAQYLVRAPGQVRTLDDLRQIVVGAAAGVPVRVRDVADVFAGEALRTGAATADGREVVLGTVFMLVGQNSRTVAQAVHRKLVEVNRGLPAGVRAVTVYDRTVLVDKAIRTVQKNLLEGAVLVVAVLFVVLGNLRAALLTALVIPLAMLFTFTGMAVNQVSANLMSLGALDFGIIVDGAVVIVENCVRRLGQAQGRLGRPLTPAERRAEVFAAARQVRRPLVYGQLIIMVVYLPVFALGGVEGKLFHPMALTVVLALLGAMLLSVTFVPAAVALFIGQRVAEHDNRLVRGATRLYEPLLARAMAVRPLVLTVAGVAVALAALLATRLGTEFVPQLDEGDLAVQAMRVPGTSLTQSVQMQQQLEAVLKAKFPEIERVFSRTGTAEVASDPMPPNVSDAYVMLRPVEAWPVPRRTHESLVRAIQQTVDALPGSTHEMSQPIQLRFNELLSGVRSDVAVKLFGDDMAALEQTAAAVAAVLERVPGAADVKVEQTTGLPVLTVLIDRERAARHGLDLADVQDTLATAVGGRTAGTVFEGDRRFDVVVRLPETLRHDVEALRRLPIALPQPQEAARRGAGGADARVAFIPLGELATLAMQPGPNQVSREDGQRRVVVSANVRGRDLGGFVAEATRAVREQVPLRPGQWIGWGGQAENLQSAAQRLRVVVPAALALVFVLLFAMFGNLRDGLLVFTGIPFALTGGVVALWARGLPLSISAAVGFIALCGVAVLNGLVMIAFIRRLQDEGLPIEQAVREGALGRLRPVLMTALVASLGFVPMALATGTGAEVQRPLATVVIGGLVSSTVLTLCVLPLLVQWAGRRAGEGAATSAEKDLSGISPASP